MKKKWQSPTGKWVQEKMKQTRAEWIKMLWNDRVYGPYLQKTKSEKTISRLVAEAKRELKSLAEKAEASWLNK